MKAKAEMGREFNARYANLDDGWSIELRWDMGLTKDAPTQMMVDAWTEMEHWLNAREASSDESGYNVTP